MGRRLLCPSYEHRYQLNRRRLGVAMNNSPNYTAALGRILLAAIFIVAGFNKVMSPEQTQQYIASANLPNPVVAYWIAVAVELGGGLCLFFGIATRFAALILAVFSIATAITFHAKFGDQAQSINFMKNVAIAGGMLQVLAFGSGGLALDRIGSRD